MDIRAEARRLATVATVFVWVGWFFVLYAIIAGIFWWIDLTSKPQFNFLQALGLSAAAIGGPIFLALIIAGMGHFLRLFALWAARESNT
jgi:amino acid transporter